MDADAKTPPPADASTEVPRPASVVVVEPAAVYVPACGVLCDIFWWARRTGPSAPNS